MKESRTPVGLYVGCLGEANLGDEIVYDAARGILEPAMRVRPDTDVSRLNFMLRRIPDLGVILLGGGTLITKSGLYLERLRKAARAAPKKPMVSIGTGVGDARLLETFGIRTDTAGWRDFLNERAAFLGVRGPLSKGFLEEWGVERPIHVTGDVALWFARPEIAPRAQARKIGLNLGPSRGLIHGRDERKVMEVGAQLLRLLDREGWQVTLFPVIAADVEYLKETVKLAGVGDVRMFENYLDLDAVLAAMEEQDVFVGEKLHSVVLAATVYTPVVMLEYRTKCRDFMLSIDRGEWTHRTDELDVDRIYAQVVDLHDRQLEHQQAIQASIAVHHAALASAGREVLRIAEASA